MEFSPFEDGKLACATSQYFGIIGNGRQFVLGTRTGRPEMAVLGCFDSRVIPPHASFVAPAPVAIRGAQDGLYDCTWSESNDNHLVSASGDGSLKVVPEPPSPPSYMSAAVLNNHRSVLTPLGRFGTWYSQGGR